MALCALALAAPAQEQGAVFQGAKLEGDALVVTLVCAPGWHIYSAVGDRPDRTRIELEPGPRKIAGPIAEPPLKHHRQEYEGGYVSEYDYLDGTVVFRAPLAPTGAAGDAVKGSITWMACNDDGCLPEATATFSLPLGPATGAATRPADGATTRPALRTVQRPKAEPPQRSIDPLTFVSMSWPERVQAGATFDLEVKVRVNSGWHIYDFTDAGVSVPTSFAVEPTAKDRPTRVRLAGPAKASRPAVPYGPPEERARVFEGATTFVVPLTVDGAAASEKEAFRLVVRYQTCDAVSCLPPTEAGFGLDVAVDGASPERGAPAATDVGPETREAAPPPTGAGASASPAAPAGALRVRSATIEPARARAGDEVSLTVQLDAPARLNAGIADLVLVEGAADWTPIDAASVRVSEGVATVTRRFRLSDETRDGDLAVAGRATLDGAVGAFTASIRVATPLWSFLLLAMLAAAGALLTPCVFPMIPVTVSFFTKQAEKSGGRSPFGMGALYAFGIVASFTLIGLVFTLALGQSGAASFAMHPITQLAIAALFIVFSLSLFGAFEIQLPAFLLNLVGSAQGRGGSAGVLLMGFLFALTTFTCTAPFVGGLLAGAATSGDYLRPTLGMVAFSSVLAAPFFWLSVSPSYLKRLPRAGGWMNEVKVVMGFVELGAALKFLAGFDVEIFNRTFCLVVAVALFTLCGLYLLGTYRLPHDGPREKTSVTHLMLALGSFALALHLAGGLDGAPTSHFIDGYLPVVEREKSPRVREFELAERIAASLGGREVGRAAAGPPRTGLDRLFLDDFDGARAEAVRLGKPIFIDFTGFT
ncbi:MAG TPA: protein-disulfide reductase DsbD domain-containing protein [Planctomycetota bacterium]|nr:protein-disulfide reductase DsbD domain-containing protein [Planctomycetota bacterium]